MQRVPPAEHGASTQRHALLNTSSRLYSMCENEFVGKPCFLTLFESTGCVPFSIMLYSFPENHKITMCVVFLPDCRFYFNLSYSSSETASSHSFEAPSAGTEIAMCWNQESAAAPCQCFTSAGIFTTSPGRSLRAGFPHS